MLGIEVPFVAKLDWFWKRALWQGYSPVTDRQLTFHPGRFPDRWRILRQAIACAYRYVNFNVSQIGALGRG